jgi:hypothetical protein
MIRKYLGFQDPNLDPAPDPSINKQKIKKTFISTSTVL